MKLLDLFNMTKDLRNTFPDNTKVVISIPYNLNYLEINDRYFDPQNEQIILLTKETIPKIKLGKWKNRKTENIYEVTEICINSTNARNGEIMVSYQKDNDKFVREINEFKDKFVNVD